MANSMPKNIPPFIAREIEKKGGLKNIIDKLPADNDLDVLAKIHHALSDPIRLKIMYFLNLQNACVCLLKEIFNIDYSRLSYHLSLLKDCELIEGERSGNYIIYRITSKGRKYLECAES